MPAAPAAGPVARPAEGLPVVEVALAIIVQASDAGAAARVLVTRRMPDAALGGYWEFPGGKREPGESLAETACREAKEEVGVTVAVTGELPVLRHTYPDAVVELYPFLCRHLGGQPTALQVADWRWVVPGDLPAYRFPPANAPLLATLARDLR